MSCTGSGFARRVIVQLAVLLVLCATVQSAPTDVLDNGHKIGTIDFANYGVRYSYFDSTANERVTHAPPRRGVPFVDVDDAGGANFEATFNFLGCPPGETLRPGTQFRWLQIVYTNAPQTNAVRGNAPTTGYVDPWSPPGGGNGVGGTGYEDLKPFYWTDTEWANPNLGGNPAATNTLKFSDTSQRPFTAADTKEVTWKADLNLVCTWEQKIHVLGYYTWGWKMPMGMAGDFSKVITLDPATAAFTAGASPGLNGILTAATEFGPGYAGDPNRQGWTLTNESCCIVPEPGVPALLLVMMMAVILLRTRRLATAGANV